MRNVYFLFVMINVAALTAGSVHAAPSSALDKQLHSERSATSAGGQFLGRRHDRQPASSMSANPGNKVFIDKQEIMGRALTNGPRSAFSLNGHSFNNVRVRGPGPAIVGGPTNKTRITASINGTGLKRKW